MPLLEIRPQTADEAFKYLKNIYKKRQFYKKNDYKINLPDHPKFIDLYQNDKELNADDEKELEKIFKKDIFPKLDLKAVKEFSNCKSIILKCCEKMVDWQKQWGFKLLSNYTIVLTHYGPGGSYDPSGYIIIKIDNQRKISDTIIHEIVHIGIEDIVNKFSLEHLEKERLVDLICKNAFSDTFLDYQSQKIGDTFLDTFFNKKSLKNLPLFLKNYIKLKQTKKTYSIFNLKIDDLSDHELNQTIKIWLSGQTAKTIVTPNPEFFLLARQDKEFAELLNQADLSLPDGAGLEYAVAALTDSFLNFRHTGVDTVDCLVQTNANMAFVGCKSPKISATAIKNLQKKYPNSNLVAVDPGNVSTNGAPSDQVIKTLQQIAPKILAVALGQGKQERFIAKILPQLPSVRIAIGIGGALDMIAGLRPRAPRFMRQMGLEWLWRLAKEPKRWRRIFRAIFVFPVIVIWSTIQKHKFCRACWRTVRIWLNLKG